MIVTINGKQYELVRDQAGKSCSDCDLKFDCKTKFYFCKEYGIDKHFKRLKNENED